MQLLHRTIQNKLYIHLITSQRFLGLFFKHFVVDIVTLGKWIKSGSCKTLTLTLLVSIIQEFISTHFPSSSTYGMKTIGIHIIFHNMIHIKRF